MLTWIDGIILVLATQRLAGLWFEELLRPVRDRLASRPGRWGYLARCHLCLSVWSAAVVAGTWVVPGGRWPLLVLALSAANLNLDSLMRRIMAPSQTAMALDQLSQQLSMHGNN